MAAYYDSIAQHYQQVHELPKSEYIDAYTYLNLLGELAGKSILDLGCGEGFYTRQFSHLGATRIVGVELSPKMIELAKQEEAREPLGIEYIVADVCELGQIGSFELVVASYLLNHAQTKAQLLKMCQTIYANLKPSGRFVAINDNVAQSPESYPLCEKYGLTKSISGSLAEGVPIALTFFVDGQKFSLYNYYLSRAIYEWAFRTAGFKKIRWHQPIVSPEGVQEFGQEFWQDFLDCAAIIGIECLK
ncbi:MAG: class I SAM-dependent methyltransferase [Xenococcaceae cyanobacterium MO_188.B32]|nr:class I SAM-dependent methyltransferase [Xenococcaceae cyanobacterium MO_188.B32]